MSPSVFARGIRSILWATGESFGTAAISMAAFLVMAHVLDPRDFGVVALAGAFVYFVNFITGHSFADALVQRPDIGSDHLDTAFWSTTVLALGLAAACAAGAEPFAAGVGEPAAAPVLRLLAVVIPIGAVASVPGSLLRRRMRFRELATCMLAGRALGAATGIAMVLGGFGLWSLVGQQIAGSLATTLAVCLASRWSPGGRFSWRRFRELGSFGFHVSASVVLAGAGEQALNVLIGAFFGSTTLGYFNIAWRTVQLVRSLFTGAVYHVGFSTFSRLQHDLPAVAAGYVRATELSCLVGFPVAVAMAVMAGPTVAVLFGAGWQASAPLLALLAIEMVPGFFAIFMTACYRALGRPEIVLWTALAYVVVGLAGAAACAGLGVAAVTAAWVSRSFVLLPIHVVLLGRVLGVKPVRIARIALAPIVAATVMGAAMLAVRGAVEGSVSVPIELGSAALSGALVYVAAVALLAPSLLRFAARAGRVMLLPQGPQSLREESRGRPG
jgi:PST family polysaccharide transporter